MTLVEAQELRGATVLITGADGFIGSYLVDACVDGGADVHAFVRATSSGVLNNIEHLRGRITVHEGDVTDMHSVRQALAELCGTKPAIFHLAAQAHIGESWTRPFETASVNFTGTLDISRAEREFGFRAEIRLDEGLRRTVNWYMEQRAHADPRRQPVLPS